MPDALMVSSSFLPGRGGIESFLAELCDELAPRLAVLAPASRDRTPIPKDLGYEASGYAGTMLVPNARISGAIVREAQRLGTHKVLFGTPWPLALLGPRLARDGLSYAVIVHGAEMLVPSAVPLVNRRLAVALSRADLLLAVSDFTRRKLEDFLTRHKQQLPDIDLLRARVDLNRFNPDAASEEIKTRLGLTADQPMILNFGRQVRRKGTHRLIKTMRRVEEIVPNAALVIAGTGPELARLKRLAGRTGARVVFAGRVPEADAPAYYASAAVYALPVADRWFGLDVEGLGVVLLEAAAAGTPVVTGRSGGTPEAVIHGRSGYVIDANDERALSEAIIKLLRDRDLGVQMGTKGREHVASEFSKRPLPEPLLHWLNHDNGGR